MQISVVLPCHNEEENIGPIAERLISVLEGAGVSDFELIFVDDGSHDATAARIRAGAAGDQRIRLVRLVRNFGHQGALLAGLHAAFGQAVITMDSDFQHPPELLPTLIEAWHQGAKVVQTVRQETVGVSFFKRVTSRLFYRFFNALSDVPLGEAQADFRLLDRSVVEQLLATPENVLFLRGLLAWYRFPTTIIPFTAGERFAGISKYTFRKMLRLATEGITSFSVAPLRFLALSGLGASVLAFLYAIYAVVVRVLENTAVPGWASLTVLIAGFFSLHFFFLAILSQYVAVMIAELKNRPSFVVAEDTARQPPPIHPAGHRRQS